ncbi:MAG: hypothetical protein JSV98_05520 [candidate division WOR-3 bacterium]|nr:MAG: hypothetical protein JSV98_05520 [candidate division WOR-3 bacterium]
MKVSPFSTIDLPYHHEASFSNALLGIDPYRKGEGGDPGVDISQSTMKDMLLRARDRYFRGFYQEGLTLYAQVLSHDEENQNAWTDQVRILVDVGRCEAAAYWSDVAARRLSQIPVLRNAKAFALAHGGLIKEAKEIINVPVGTAETPMIWLLRGEVFLRIRANPFQRLFAPYKGIGRMGAFFCFLRALNPVPRDPFINQRIGLAYLLAGDAGRASEHLRFSLNMVPDNPLTLYGLAQCYRISHDREHAVAYVKRAIAGNPNLDCAIELLQWLHKPRLSNIGELFLGISKKKRRR